jgi:SRSO17 transposase
VEKNNHPAAADATVDHDTHAGLLDDLLGRVASCSARRETRVTCRDMVHGLLTELEDHNCQAMAEAAGHPGPHRMRHLLSRARVDERRMPGAAADRAVGRLAPGQDESGADAVLIVDETAGEKSSDDCVIWSRFLGVLSVFDLALVLRRVRFILSVF